MIFVELTSSIRFAVVTSSLNGEGVELSLANKIVLVFEKGFVTFRQVFIPIGKDN